MSKISISVDTETKELSVAIDGSAVDNVNCVRIDKYSKEDAGYGPEFYMSIGAKEKMGDVDKHIMLMATANQNLPLDAVQSQYKGWVKAGRLYSDIAKYLGRK